MLIPALAALAGCLAVLFAPVVAPPGALWAGAAVLVLALWHRWRLVACALAGALWCALAVLSHARSLVPPLTDRLLVEATVASLPQPQGQGLSFDAEVRFPRRPDLREARLRINWRGREAWALRAGERWQLAVRLRGPSRGPHPGAVDATRLAWRDRIHGEADVIDGRLNRRLAGAPGGLLALRERLARRLAAAHPDPAAAALVAALAVGYGGDIRSTEWRSYNATGITHLIAISGMHVTLFAAIAMAALRRVWALWPWLAARIRREAFAAAGGVVCAFAYAQLAGWSIPTQRTVLMLAAALLWRCAGRADTQVSALGAALLAVLALDPFSPLAAGFWLSFVAVGVILWREGARLREAAGVAGALRLQGALSLALAPATIAQFGSLSIAGLAVNLAAIPLFTIVLVPLALAATALLMAPGLEPLGDLCGRVAAAVASPSISLLDRVGAQGFALREVAVPPWWALFAPGAMLLAVMPLGRLRWLALAALVPLACDPAPPPEGAARILHLRIGASEATLVRTRSHALLLGTADGFGTRGGRVGAVVVPAARYLGVRSLDAVIATRLTRDVAAGIGAVQALLPAREVYSASPQDALPAPMRSCAGAPARWRWDGVVVDLVPGPGRCGLMLRVAGREVRLPGAFAEGTEPAVLLDIGPGTHIRREVLAPVTGVWHAIRARDGHPGAG